MCSNNGSVLFPTSGCQSCCLPVCCHLHHPLSPTKSIVSWSPHLHDVTRRIVPSVCFCAWTESFLTSLKEKVAVGEAEIGKLEKQAHNDWTSHVLTVIENYYFLSQRVKCSSLCLYCKESCASLVWSVIPEVQLHRNLLNSKQDSSFEL